MVRIVSALIALQCVASAASAEPDAVVMPQPDFHVVALPAVLPVVPPGVQFASTDSAAVMLAIGQMQAQLTAFDPVSRDDAISVAARTFSDHWRVVVQTHTEQQSGSLEDMIGGLLVENAESVADFLNTPPMEMEPSMFSDSIFIRLSPAPFPIPEPFPITIPVAGFFGS